MYIYNNQFRLSRAHTRSAPPMREFRAEKPPDEAAPAAVRLRY